MSPTSQFFNLKLQDLRFAADFYNKVYDRRFSGSSENNPRVPLIREATVAGTLHALDQLLETIRVEEPFLAVVENYALGSAVSLDLDKEIYRNLAWYLLRNAVPASNLLVVLRTLAQDAQHQCSSNPPPEGTSNVSVLERGIKDVLHWTGTKMMTSLGSGWSLRSLEEILTAWSRT
jgi:anaphase-promoting complex subunit 1